MRLTGDQKEISEILFQFFLHAGTVEEFISNFEVFLLFLRLRYGADLGRTRLVFRNSEKKTKISAFYLNCINSI